MSICETSYGNVRCGSDVTQMWHINFKSYGAFPINYRLNGQ